MCVCLLITCEKLHFHTVSGVQNEGPKGQFAVEQIKIAEIMAKDIFGKEYPYAFQVSAKMCMKLSSLLRN